MINAIPMNWRVVIFSLKKKYPTSVIRITEIEIHRMLVIATPSYLRESAKNSPAPQKNNAVSARKIGFLFVFQSFAHMTAIKSNMFIAAMSR